VTALSIANATRAGSCAVTGRAGQPAGQIVERLGDGQREDEHRGIAANIVVRAVPSSARTTLPSKGRAS